MQYEIIDLKDYSSKILPLSVYAGDFRFFIEFRLVQGGGMLYFHDVRKWLITSYGWSDQVGNAVSNVDNQHWTWNVNHDSYRIYLKSDKELMMFKLKFPQGVRVE